MSETAITYRTDDHYGDGDLHIWEATIDNTVIGALYVDMVRAEIANIEVNTDYQGQGIARRLYETAAAQMPIYHAPEQHRTPEGDAFARAVGGETVAPYACDCWACETADEEI
ncbi:GNAT family N-acetyltransferase [Nocardia puris]|uniref:GNAT family N-acetyltransferase n=1 Tax=Nocardia puris TaxID=208602 RepID=UPI002E22A52B